MPKAAKPPSTLRSPSLRIAVAAGGVSILTLSVLTVPATNAATCPAGMTPVSGLSNVCERRFTDALSGQVFTVPAGVQRMEAYLVGAGGGGGSGISQANAGVNLGGGGGGGGGGGTTVIAVAPTQSLATGLEIVVGVGERGPGGISPTAAGNGNPGSAGGRSQVQWGAGGGTVSADGGTRGLGGETRGGLVADTGGAGGNSGDPSMGGFQGGAAISPGSGGGGAGSAAVGGDASGASGGAGGSGALRTSTLFPEAVRFGGGGGGGGGIASGGGTGGAGGGGTGGVGGGVPEGGGANGGANSGGGGGGGGSASTTFFSGSGGAGGDGADGLVIVRVLLGTPGPPTPAPSPSPAPTSDPTPAELAEQLMTQAVIDRFLAQCGTDLARSAICSGGSTTTPTVQEAPKPPGDEFPLQFTMTGTTPDGARWESNVIAQPISAEEWGYFTTIGGISLTALQAQGFTFDRPTTFTNKQLLTSVFGYVPQSRYETALLINQSYLDNTTQSGLTKTNLQPGQTLVSRSGRTDSDGTARIALDIPADAPSGLYTLRVTGVLPGPELITLSWPVQVLQFGTPVVKETSTTVGFSGNKTTLSARGKTKTATFAATVPQGAAVLETRVVGYPANGKRKQAKARASDVAAALRSDGITPQTERVRGNGDVSKWPDRAGKVYVTLRYVTQS
jgi:hypothetical protein